MGGANASKFSKKTKIYPPNSTFVPFPPEIEAAPGSVVLYFNAKPPDYQLKTRYQPGLFWWISLDFVPFQDNQLFVSVGAYIQSPGSRTVSKADSRLKGLIYRWKFNKGDNSVDLHKGTCTSALPNVMVHPSDASIVYVGQSTINITKVKSKESIHRERSARNNNFQYAAFSPNGHFIANMARCNNKIEIGVLYIDPLGILVDIDCVDCETLCPKFRPDGTYSDRYQCIFSPDSKYIAATTSNGHFIVISKKGLAMHCGVSPGIVEAGVEELANERSFDFDPRFEHERIAFGSSKNYVHFCNIDNGTIEQSVQFEDDETIQCLKYAQRGNCLAVALSTGFIKVLEPDEGECIITLDGSASAPKAPLLVVNGKMPEAVCMCFTTAADILAVSHTDGYVRLWKLPPTIHLQELCKLAILRHVNVRHLRKLPLPPKILQEMCEIYEGI